MHPTLHLLFSRRRAADLAERAANARRNAAAPSVRSSRGAVAGLWRRGSGALRARPAR